MMSLIKKCSLILLLLTLSSCQRQFTYSYLTQHPDVLKREVENCQKANAQSEANSNYCEIVMNAASTVMAIINEQQASPEAFGQKILTAELACVQSRTALEKAKQNLQTLKSQKSPSTEIKAAEEKLANLSRQHQDESNETKVLLAVAGLNSPE